MAHPDPRARARAILSTYLRTGVEAGGFTWKERNDRHMDELIDCLAALISQEAAPDDFAADLDAPAPHPTRGSTFVGKRKQSDKEVLQEAWRHVQRGDAA